MKISVIVPTRGGVKNLSECLKSLRIQTVRPHRIIVVSDKTDSSVKDVAAKYGAILANDKKKTLGNAYFLGIKRANSDIIVFIDDDAFAPADWLAKIRKEFEREDIDILGGEDLLPKNSPKFQQAAYQIDLARMAGKPLHGKAAFRRLRATNIAYRKRIFSKENFNRSLKGLQEPELHHRLMKHGFRAKFNPDIFVYHKRRDSLTQIFSQIYRNGKAKVKLLRLHKEMVAAYDILSVAYFILLLFSIFKALNGSFWYVFALAAITMAYFLLKPLVYCRRNLKFYRQLLGIVFVREAAYAAGFLRGLLNWKSDS